MDDEDLGNLLQRAQFVFEGTVTATEQATVPDVRTDDHTVVMRVDRVLQAPAALAHATGIDLTVQLAAGAPVLAEGDQTVLFTTSLAYGEGLAVSEVGRADVGELGEVVTAAGAPARLVGARPGRPRPVLAATLRLDDTRLRTHADEADAVVIGTVVGVERAVPEQAVGSEHDPNWWRATLTVDSVEKGNVGSQVQVLFANSADVHWAHLPKPRPAQHGLWLLHASSGAQAALAPFILLDNDDAHPSDAIDRIRR